MTRTTLTALLSVISIVCVGCRPSARPKREVANETIPISIVEVTSSDSTVLEQFEEDRKVALALYERVKNGRLLRKNDWEVVDANVRYSSSIVGSGDGIVVDQRVFYLRDVSGTAEVISKTGLGGVAVSLKELEGESQIARLVAIIALDTSLNIDGFRTIVFPILSHSEGRDRDLNESEIQILKEQYLTRYKLALAWQGQKSEAFHSKEAEQGIPPNDR